MLTLSAPTAAAAIRSRKPGARPGGEVVAAHQPQLDVGKQQGPERQLRPVSAAGVRDDDGVISHAAGVEIGVIGQCHLDDTVHAVRN